MIKVDRKNDGKRSIWYELSDGMKHGKYLCFIDGFLCEKGNYNLNMRDGLWESYYKNGKMKVSSNFIDGKFDGEYKAYYKDGNIQSNGYYRNGKHDGKWYYYYSSGLLEIRGLYKKGKRVGKWYYYHNGLTSERKMIIECMGVYQQDKHAGIWKYYDDMGNKIAEKDYEGDKY